MLTPSLQIHSVIIQSTERNANARFTSKKLDKLDELVDSVKNLTINNAKYYEPNIATANDAQDNLTSNPETVTHPSNNIFNKNY